MSKQAGSLGGVGTGGVGTSGVGTLGALDPDLSDSDSSSSESNVTISLVSNETRLGRRRKTTTRRTIVSKDASTLRTMPTSVINDQPGLKSDMIDEEVNELVNEVARRRTCRGCFCFHQKSPATSAHDAAQQRKGRMAVMLACFCTFSMGGVVFGISSLFPLLYQQGFWRSLCDGTKKCTRSTKKCCESQLVRYSLVASISFFFADGAAAGWGELADRKGPWVCLLFASSLSVSGFVFLALGSVSTGDVADRITTMALFILGCAGPGVFNGGYLGGVQVTNDVPTLKAALTSFSAAAFDGSALVFMLFQAAASGLQLGLAIPSLVWAGVTAVCAATFTKFLHSELAGPKVVEPSHHLEGSNGVLGASPMKNDRSCTAIDTMLSPQAEKPSRKPSASIGATLCMPFNVLLIFFVGSYTLASSFYVESQIDQFQIMFGEETATQISTFFNYAFPIGGFFTAFPASKLLDKVGGGDRDHVYWGLVWLCAVVFCFLSIFPNYQCQVTAAAMFGPIRCFQWASYFQFLANEKRYAPESIGRALGYNNVLVALLGDGMPYLLSYLVNEDSWGQTLFVRYTYVKFGLLLMVILAGIFPLYLTIEAVRAEQGSENEPSNDDEDSMHGRSSPEAIMVI